MKLLATLALASALIGATGRALYWDRDLYRPEPRMIDASTLINKSSPVVTDRLGDELNRHHLR
jgi:hypothetical protein